MIPKWQWRAFLVLLSLLWIWIGAINLLPFIVDGFFYRLESPLAIVAQDEYSITFEVTREAKTDLVITSAKKAICDGIVTTFVPVRVRVEAGKKTTDWRWEIPSGVEGHCYLGIDSSYKPLGDIGPELHQEAVTEEFYVAPKH